MLRSVAIAVVAVVAGYLIASCGGYECRCPTPPPVPTGTFKITGPAELARPTIPRPPYIDKLTIGKKRVVITYRPTETGQPLTAEFKRKR